MNNTILLAQRDKAWAEIKQLRTELDEANHQWDYNDWPFQTHLRAKTKEKHIEQIRCLFGNDLFAKLQAEVEKHRWIPIENTPKNDTYYIAVIGVTGDEFGETYEWLYFNGMWFYAKSKKPYPRCVFITHYKPISRPESEPKGEIKCGTT